LAAVTEQPLYDALLIAGYGPLHRLFLRGSGDA